MDALSFIKQERFIALARHVPLEAMPELVRALHHGGVRILEVTFDPCDPETLLKTRKAIEITRDSGMLAGAGTVLSVEMAEAAHAAGASFALSPDTNAQVIRRTKELGMLSIPGAYTPTEIVNAYALGADIVKLFPILPHQVDYVKVVMSPLAHIPFMVTGGVNPDTAAAFLAAGALAVAAGASLTKPDLLRSKNWAEISRIANLHMDATRKR